MVCAEALLGVGQDAVHVNAAPSAPEQPWELGIAVLCIFVMSWEPKELHHQSVSPQGPCPCCSWEP